MKETNDKKIEFRFSKYVKTAIKRARRDYLMKECEREAMEQLSGLEVVLNLEGSEAQEWNQPEEVKNVPWNAEKIRVYMDEQVSENLGNALHRLTDAELVVVFAKVYRECTFEEIGQVMGMKWQKAASVYYYALRKLKKVGEGTNGF